MPTARRAKKTTRKSKVPAKRKVVRAAAAVKRAKVAPRQAAKAKPARAAAAVTTGARPAKKGEDISLGAVMKLLEAAGSEQTRKTYGRHGATGPMFGVSFGTLSKLQKRIKVDHELALELWDTGNVDARNLAMKIADPATIKADDLDRWARENPMRMCGLYIGSLAQESGQGRVKAREWLASQDSRLRAAGWTLIGVLANRDESESDDTFEAHLDQIVKMLKTEANEVKAAMNGALIAIGGRSKSLRDCAVDAARRIGKVEVDYGPTACETPDAIPYIEKMWGYCKGRFPSPAAAERGRESMRTRC